MSASAALLSLKLQGDEKGLLSAEDRDVFFKQLKQEKPENKSCFDCGARNAPWLSVSFAVFVCINCSGAHRSLGSRISFVRSCDLDKIRVDEAIRMELGGNGKARNYFKSHGFSLDNKVEYRSRLAERYRRQLDAELNEVLSEHRPELLSTSSSSLGGQEVEEIDDKLFEDTLVADSPPGSSNEGLSNVLVTKSPVVVYASGDGPRVDSCSLKPKEDFDFDFDSAFDSGAAVAERASQEKQKTAATGGRFFLKTTKAEETEPSNASDDFAERPVKPSKAVLPPRDLSNAKSVSAQDFRQTPENEGTEEYQNNMARFKDADCISSEAFFGPGGGNAENGQRNWDDQLSTQMSILKDSAVQKASEVAVAAQETFRSAANWFSRVTQ